MSTAKISKSSPSKTYQFLLNDIARLYTQTQASVVGMYWEIGRRIVEVEQRGGARAGYGRQLIERLSSDLTERFSSGFSLRNLNRMRRFYLQHKIMPAPAKLSWSHQAELMSVPDVRMRQRLAMQAQRYKLSTDELRALVRRSRGQLRVTPSAHNGKLSKSSNNYKTSTKEFLKPNRGTPGLFRIKEISGALYWDLGFESYRELSSVQARSFKEGDIVRLTDKGTLKLALEVTSSQLYTYETRLLRVVDGDTLWMLIRLKANDWRKEKLRLRGIDCPELGTSAGAAAKRYVQILLQNAQFILITSTKPDKWDRYLSDIFLKTTAGDEVFLNNRLLETNHARLYEAISSQDWES